MLTPSGRPVSPPAVMAGARVWLRLCLLLAAGALAVWWLPTGALDGEPGRWLAQPWRLWTAAWVHWSSLHLGANLAGVVVLGLYGCAAEVHRRDAVAWLAAWPLAHLALALWDLPGLQHYGGLSGVLHAGVAVVSTSLLARRGQLRLLGAAVWAGMLLKLVSESSLQPWPAWMPMSGWDLAVAPQAHAAGALAGLLCALAAALWSRRV